jgi:2-polyprenyl-3-methyl-5-hydroxy-6-metoxy-1,4-benzoquinol methylase
MTPTCNICASNEKTVAYDPQHKLYQCVQCDHTFTLIDAQYHEKNIYAEDYFDDSHKNWFKNPNYSLFGYIRQTVVDLLKKHDFKLLDIGSGRGDLLEFMRKTEPKAELWGIDGAPCSSPDFKFIQGDFMKEKIKDRFDAVVSLACIEHVEDPSIFVKKIHDLVKPNGLVVIMTINSGGMMYGLARILNKIGLHSGYNRLFSDHHIHHFTNQSLRLVLEKNNFRIVSQKNHNYSLASVDYPPAGQITLLLYKALTAIIFFLSTIFNNGISQTVVCVPKQI